VFPGGTQVWTELIQTMKEKELLPSINFMFSKKMIDSTAAMLSHIDLCTNAEKGRIGAFMTRHAPQLRCPKKSVLVTVSMPCEASTCQSVGQLA
jgi:superfamily II RNA helicase